VGANNSTLSNSMPLCINTLIQIINKGGNTTNQENGREKDRKCKKEKSTNPQ
jgi:hypothetical protein